MSHQRCDDLIVPVGFVELPHSEEVTARESADARFPSGNVVGQLVHRTLAPLSGGYAAADDLTDLPVKIDQGGIHRLHRPITGGADQTKDFSKSGFVGSLLPGVNKFAHADQNPILTDVKLSAMGSYAIQR